MSLLRVTFKQLFEKLMATYWETSSNLWKTLQASVCQFQLVTCCVNFLCFSKAWRRRRAGMLHDRNRQNDQNRQRYHRHQQYDHNRQNKQAVADEMENDRETEHENDLVTKLEDQEHDIYYDDNYYDDEM